MARSIAFVIYFWGHMFFTPLFLIPYLVCRAFRAQGTAERYVLTLSSLWARHMLWFIGADVTVDGLSRVPRHGRVCFVSNHQGYADILVIQGYIPKNVGFIAKKELSRAPVLRTWMKVMHCVFIERGRIEKAREALRRGIDLIRAGHPMLVFPEGTRSRGGPMRSFRPGALRLAREARATIVPLTVDGTYTLLEEKNRISRGSVRFTIHDPVEPEEWEQMSKSELADRLWKTVASAMKDTAEVGSSK